MIVQTWFFSWKALVYFHMLFWLLWRSRSHRCVCVCVSNVDCLCKQWLNVYARWHIVLWPRRAQNIKALSSTVFAGMTGVQYLWEPQSSAIMLKIICSHVISMLVCSKGIFCKRCTQIYRDLSTCAHTWPEHMCTHVTWAHVYTRDLSTCVQHFHMPLIVA